MNYHSDSDTDYYCEESGDDINLSDLDDFGDSDKEEPEQ